MNRKIFITRNENDVSSLMTLLRTNGYEVEALSLIETEFVAFDLNLPESNWIFFSSATAVRYFFKQNPIVENRKLAAIGKGTSRELSKYATVDFEGNNIDTMETARQFASLIGNETVLFPGPQNGLGRIQSVLPKPNVRNLICYRTFETPLIIGHSDIIVFSSPSNVRSFFQRNKMSDSQQAIAYGNSTAGSLNEYAVRNVIIPDTLSDEDLLKAIKAISGS